MTFPNLILIVAGTLTGLFAGLLYAFSVAVVPGLRAASAKAHIEVMQAINVGIENPVFFLSFMGPIFLLPLAAYLHRGQPGAGLLVLAALLHIVGGCAVTIAGNLPLNAKLAKIKASALSEAEADKVRRDFQRPGSAWMKLHAVRTLSATAALACVIAGALQMAR